VFYITYFIEIFVDGMAQIFKCSGRMKEICAGLPGKDIPPVEALV